MRGRTVHPLEVKSCGLVELRTVFIPQKRRKRSDFAQGLLKIVTRDGGELLSFTIPFGQCLVCCTKALVETSEFFGADEYDLVDGRPELARRLNLGRFPGLCMAPAHGKPHVVGIPHRRRNAVFRQHRPSLRLLNLRRSEEHTSEL